MGRRVAWRIQSILHPVSPQSCAWKWWAGGVDSGCLAARDLGLFSSGGWTYPRILMSTNYSASGGAGPVHQAISMLTLRNKHPGLPLVAQWLRVCLPVQGTRVRALVWEDSTCRGATGPMSNNYGACASGACAPQQERPRW